MKIMMFCDWQTMRVVEIKKWGEVMWRISSQSNICDYVCTLLWLIYLIFKYLVHMGKRNQELSYEMGGKVLKVSEEERDLGVIMHRSAKPSRQCAEASKKDNSTLGMIRRTIVTRDKDTILRLYKTLVRPQLEYCIQVWSPYLKQDMEKLEKV